MLKHYETTNKYCFAAIKSTHKVFDSSVAILYATGSRSRQKTVQCGAMSSNLFVWPPPPNVMSTKTLETKSPVSGDQMVARPLVVLPHVARDQGAGGGAGK